MGLITKIEQQSHILIPVFILLTLYINNMPIDFNIKPLSINDYIQNAPKPRFKNILLIISFILILFFFEIEKPIYKPFLGAIIGILVLSGILYSVYYFMTGTEYIKNGVVSGGLENWVNDINILEWETAIANSLVALFAMICIIFLFSSMEKGEITDPSIVSVLIIMCIIVLYLKADGVIGFINGIKNYAENNMDKFIKPLPGEDMVDVVFRDIYIVSIIILAISTFIGKPSLNPYVILGKDTNHKKLVVFIMLLFAYMFPVRHFVLFTIFIAMWDYGYSKDIKFIKNHKKLSILGTIILFLIIDGAISKTKQDNRNTE